MQEAYDQGEEEVVAAEALYITQADAARAHAAAADMAEAELAMTEMPACIAQAAAARARAAEAAEPQHQEQPGNPDSQAEAAALPR